MIYVLYHTACYDGFGAAFAAWKKFGNDAKYIPVGYGHDMPNMYDGSTVYIVDFSYDKEDLLELASRMEKVVLLDHHASAMKKHTDTDLPTFDSYDGNLEIHFDMDRSGAGITWDFFHGKHTRPRLIDLIEDRDLWKFKDPWSKKLHSYLLSQPFDFSVYAHLIFPAHLEAAVNEGAALERMTDQIVEKICKNARIYGNFFGHRAVVVNTSSHWSEVGNKLLDMYPDVEFAAAYTDLKDNVRMFSLRSKAPFDVSKVAGELGGGGHAQAAGFKAKIQVPFEQTIYTK